MQHLNVTPRPAVPLSDLEVSYGLALGRWAGATPLAPSSADPRAALDGVLRQALSRPPCLVSFSGGLDSSALLAACVRVARSEGLPDPVPATLVFQESGPSDEREWQHLVLDHLGLARSSWLRFELTDELDAVGPVARDMMTRHGGVVWPFNLHFHLPIIEAAAGGSVVTGFGGDELGRSSAGMWGERLVAQRRLGGPKHLALVAYSRGPSRIRWARQVTRARGHRAELPWLTPRARWQLRMARADEDTHPLGWGAVLRDYFWCRRYIRVCRENFSIVAAPYDVEVVHPFVEAPLLASLGEGHFAGLGGRRGVWELLFAGLLPEALLARTTKAVFSDPLWTETAQQFARSWSGRGLDERLVDVDVLRAHWLSPERSVMSTSLLQAAWLADHGPR
jgi:hypothetical protein